MTFGAFDDEEGRPPMPDDLRLARGAGAAVAFDEELGQWVAGDDPGFDPDEEGDEPDPVRENKDASGHEHAADGKFGTAPGAAKGGGGAGKAAASAHADALSAAKSSLAAAVGDRFDNESEVMLRLDYRGEDAAHTSLAGKTPMFDIGRPLPPAWEAAAAALPAKVAALVSSDVGQAETLIGEAVDSLAPLATAGELAGLERAAEAWKASIRGRAAEAAEAAEAAGGAFESWLATRAAAPGGADQAGLDAFRKAYQSLFDKAAWVTRETDYPRERFERVAKGLYRRAKGRGGAPDPVRESAALREVKDASGHEHGAEVAGGPGGDRFEERFDGDGWREAFVVEGEGSEEGNQP